MKPKTFRTIVQVLLGLVIIIMLVYRAGTAEVREGMADASPGFLLMAVMIFLCVVGIMALRWMAFLNLIAVKKLDPPTSLKMIFVGLESVPLFRDCSADVLDRLAQATTEFEFADGAAIVQQGQVGNGLYVVVSGGVRIVAGTDELARLGPDDFFGELSVIDQQPRTATVFAVGETACLALASWDLMAVLEQDPHVAINLLKGLAARLRAADAQLRH